ncbi:hypothetical protein ACFWIZ_44655, partial [Streptomyces sp. NPDC127044]
MSGGRGAPPAPNRTQRGAAAPRPPRGPAAPEALYDRLHALAGTVRPRGRVGLVHGELGPDH